MLARLWRAGNPYSLFMGLRNGATMWKKVWRYLKKLKMELSYDTPKAHLHHFNPLQESPSGMRHELQKSKCLWWSLSANEDKIGSALPTCGDSRSQRSTAPIASLPLPHSTATTWLHPKGNARRDGNILGMMILPGEEIKGLFCSLSISIFLFIINIGYRCPNP